MSLDFKNLTLRNFLSTGAITQAVNFDSKELTLILGENLDLGGGGSRNAAGKSVLLHGLSYALFGSPINSIRKDNLINRTNGKGMMVTLEFAKNGIEYKIERGRKPNTLKFYVNNSLQNAQNEAQGENKETQALIESILGMSSDMFKHIMALNTYTEPFLGMTVSDQRTIIEQLLGITLLSEKAETIKERSKLNKDQLQQEEFRIKAVEEANKRVQEQIDSIKRRQRLWLAKHAEDLNKLVEQYDRLSLIDIAAELQAHVDLKTYTDNKRIADHYSSILLSQTAWEERRSSDLMSFRRTHDTLSHVDIVTELQAHKDLQAFLVQRDEQNLLQTENNRLTTQLNKITSIVDKLKNEIAILESNKCYACGQDFHDDTHESVLTGKKELLLTEEEEFAQTQIALEKNISLKVEMGEQPKTYYKTEIEANQHQNKVETLLSQISSKEDEINPFDAQLVDYIPIELGERPVTHYATESEAIEHKSTVQNLEQSIATKAAEQDPYSEQVADMESQALQEISFDTINELTRYGEHLKFMIDLLTNKDSFIRKKIIDQSLTYLNSRLSHYLEKMGLPHTVVFKNDLSVEITELGRELDFYNLSRGEMNRVILGLSFAFRDVWENLYSPINVLFIDELLDNGTDSVGMENSLGILKALNRDRQKSIWLISHRDELVSRVNSVLKVVKSQGFTTYQTEEST